MANGHGCHAGIAMKQEEEIKTRTLRQSATFDASPHDIYEMLMDSKLHSAFTGAKARISNKVGGKFTAYDDDIDGTNLELVKDKKIVQKWRTSDWPAKHYSIVSYTLIKNGNGTKLEFVQTGIPEDKYKDISLGWKEYYWERMKQALR